MKAMLLPASWARMSVVLIVLSAAIRAEAAEPYGRVRVVDGTAAIFCNDALRGDDPSINYPISAGCLVKTAGGRIEIEFLPDATVRLDSSSELQVSSTGPAAGLTELYLRKGRADMQAFEMEADGVVKLTTEFGSVTPQTPAILTITKVSDTAALDLRIGIVEVRSATYSGLVSAPRRLVLRHGTPLFGPPVSHAPGGRLRDDFSSWAERRRSGRSDDGKPSLWEEYAHELDAAGTLVPCQTGRQCWKPHALTGSPMVDGRWVVVREERVWVPAAPWGWATSHYGSWTKDESHGWLWLPGTKFLLGPVQAPSPSAPSAAAALSTSRTAAEHPIFQFLSGAKPALKR